MHWSAIALLREKFGVKRKKENQGVLVGPHSVLLALYKEDDRNRDVVFPFLTANDMLSTFPPSPKRYVIDFHCSVRR